MWTAAILAGGQATRLGGCDKAALLVGGKPILERQLGALHGLVGHILIVANDPEPFRATALPVVPDLVRGAGSLGAVYTAVSAAPDDRTLVIAGDMPFLDRGLLARLIDVGTLVDVAVPHGLLGYQPLCATYSRACVAELRLRVEAGELKIADFIREARGLRTVELGPHELARFGSEDVMFFNVNTPDDLARANQVVKRLR